MGSLRRQSLKARPSAGESLFLLACTGRPGNIRSAFRGRAARYFKRPFKLGMELLDGFSFDLFPPFENGLAAPEVDVSRRPVVQALVVSTVVVVPDELLDALFELSWQVVIVQQDPVFHRAMISLDLALRHRVVRPAADMSDAVVLEPLAKLARHVGWTVIAQQPWPMQNLDLVQT